MKRIYVVSYDEGHEAFTNARQAVLFVQAYHGLPNLIPNPDRRAWVKKAKECRDKGEGVPGPRPLPIFGVDSWVRQLEIYARQQQYDYTLITPVDLHNKSEARKIIQEGL